MTEILTAGGLVITVLLAYLQIQRNQSSSLRLQSEHLKNQLKVEVFRELIGHLDRCGLSLGKAKADINRAIRNLEYSRSKIQSYQVITSQAVRASDEKARRRLTRLTLLLEKYEIVFARFYSLRRGISDTSRTLRDTSGELLMRLILVLPNEDLYKVTSPPSPSSLTEDQLEQLKTLGQKYERAVEDLRSYLLDFGVEAQNELLGPLFEREVPRRNPADATKTVLTRDSAIPKERPKGHWL